MILLRAFFVFLLVFFAQNTVLSFSAKEKQFLTDLESLDPRVSYSLGDDFGSGCDDIYKPDFIDINDVVDASAILDFNNIYKGRVICDENENIKILILRNVKLSRVPDNLHFLDKMDILDLRGNSIYEIYDYDFKKLFKLKELYLGGNMLKSIELGSFVDLSSLQKLKIENNLLKNINKSVFLGLNSLVELDLSENYIKVLNLESFKDLIHLENLNLSFNELSIVPENLFRFNAKLKYLSLYHNKISEIEAFSFVNLTSLIWLNISDNRLSSLDNVYFKGLESLNFLEIRDNNITVIKNNTFIDLKKLKSLNVGYNYSFENNQSIKIEDYAFKGLFNLETLYLYSNNLKSLNINWFLDLRSLNSLFLQNNNFICVDRSLSKIKKIKISNDNLLIENEDYCSYDDSVFNDFFFKILIGLLLLISFGGGYFLFRKI